MKMEFFKDNISDEPLTQEQFEVFKRRCNSETGLVHAGYAIYLIDDKDEDEDEETSTEFEFLIRRCKEGYRHTKLKRFCYVLGDDNKYHLDRCYSSLPGKRHGNILHYLLWDSRLDILTIHSNPIPDPEDEKERIAFEEELLQDTLPDEDEMTLQFVPIVDEEYALDEYQNQIELPANYEPPDRGLIKDSLTIEIERALKTLTPREAYILREFFGIGTKEKSFEEIGDYLHITRERVRQIKDKAIRKMENGQRSRILKTYFEYGKASYDQSDEDENKQRESLGYNIEDISEGWMLLSEKRRLTEEAISIKEKQQKVQAYLDERITYLEGFLAKYQKLFDENQIKKSKYLRMQKDIQEDLEKVKEEKRQSQLLVANSILKLLKFDTPAKDTCPVVEQYLEKPADNKESEPQSRHNKKWTNEEVETLQDLYTQGLPYENIAEQMKRTVGAICYRLCKLGFLEYNSETGTYIKLK